MRTDRAVTMAAVLDDLGVKLRGERAPRARALPTHLAVGAEYRVSGAEPQIRNVRQAGPMPLHCARGRRQLVIRVISVVSSPRSSRCPAGGPERWRGVGVGSVAPTRPDRLGCGDHQGVYDTTSRGATRLRCCAGFGSAQLPPKTRSPTPVCPNPVRPRRHCSWRSVGHPAGFAAPVCRPGCG